LAFALFFVRSRGWRVNHSATPATATEVIVWDVKMFPATRNPSIIMIAIATVFSISC